MTKASVVKFFKDAKEVTLRHKPEILMALGATGLITTTFVAVRATPKALKHIEEEKKRLNVDKLTVIETVKATWKDYVPATVTGTASLICLIGSSSENLKRGAALTTAYKISEAALTDYKDAVKELVGDKKAQAIKEKVTKKQIEKNPVTKNDVIVTDRGNTLCYDAISGRYFYSDIDLIRKAENKINRRMLSEMYISLNEFYDELNLDHIAVGDDLGWRVEDGYIELSFGSHLSDDGRPCLVIEYNIAPRRSFNVFA